MKKFLTLLALSLFLVSCATSPRQPKLVEITYADEIRYELLSLMGSGSKLVVMDWRFVSLPEARTRELINEALVKFNTAYVVEARDCDDIAIEYVVRLRALFRRELKDWETAAPVGVVGGAMVGDIPELKIFLHGKTAYHAMVAVRCSGGKWLLVEPSLKCMVDLSSPYYEGTLELFLGVF